MPDFLKTPEGLKALANVEKMIEKEIKPLHKKVKKIDETVAALEKRVEALEAHFPKP